MITITKPILSCETLPKAQVDRPQMLDGVTYKIKPPTSNYATYVTINHVVENGRRKPFEVFINSKELEHFQWVLALTRLLSAAFRSGTDTAPLLTELRAVFDPKGGYFKKSVWMPSLVAEIGDVLLQHIKCLNDEIVASADVTLPEEKNFPEDALLCQKCFVKAVVVSDGCASCLNCGDSKCG